MLYAIVDIETTGGFAERNKIVEIAIRIHDGEKVIDQFDSLINPEVSISPTVTAIHGITDKMVVNAPKFYEIAKKLHELFQDKIFVAHNVNFDFSFVKREFESLGAAFSMPKLCTVRLSRKIFPGYPSYSLGNLCQSMGITVEDRHRAGGDVDATTELFRRLVIHDDEGFMLQSLKKNSKESFLPAHLPKEKFELLPEKEGVYYFYDEKGKVIYVGKAKNLKKRIYSHFIGSGETMVKQKFKLNIHDIHVELTGNELIALLLESYEIKRLKPIFNRALTRKTPAVGLFVYEDGKGYIRFTLARIKSGERPVITFNHIYEGRAAIERMVKEQNLCSKMAGLHKMPGACFDHTLGTCYGACIDQETPESYNERVYNTLSSLQEGAATFALIGPGRHLEEKSVVFVEKSQFKGFGYIDTQFTQSLDLESVSSHIKKYDDNLDARRIVQSGIKQFSFLKKIDF